MRLNYNTFTGRRSAFVLVAAVLILLSLAAFAVCSKQIADQLLQYMSENRTLAAMLLIQNGLVVLSVLIAALATEPDHSLKEKLGLAIDPGYSLQFLFPVLVIAILTTLGSQIGLAHLLKFFGREVKEQSLVESFRSLGPLAFVGFAAITVIAAPIAEELAFRHVFYRFVRVFLYRKEAAVVVSLVFALFHVQLAALFRTKPFPWEMLVIPVIPLFILALFLQWQYEKSKSIIPSMLIHAGFNLINVLLLMLSLIYATPPQEKTAEPSDLEEAPVQAVIQWDYNG